MREAKRVDVELIAAQLSFQDMIVHAQDTVERIIKLNIREGYVFYCLDSI